MRRPFLQTSFAFSVLVHAGLIGILFLLARQHVSSDAPIRVRLIEPPPPPTRQQEVVPPPTPRPAPKPAPPPPVTSRPGERTPRENRPARSEHERAVPQIPDGVPSMPAPMPPPPMTARPAPDAVSPPVSAAPPPPVRPSPESSLPPPAPRETLPEALPTPRSGLSLGGATPTSPGAAAPPVSPREGVSRPSLRDQLAKLGSGLTADAGGTAKRTLDLDNREPRYLDYLARLKQRIQGEWTYPEEARQVGMGGELLLVFTLNKAGTLINVQLVETSGFPVLDNEALRAVKAAAPYDPFPPHMGAEPWNISAIFRYQSPYRFRRN